MSRAWVALGSNLDEPVLQVRRALAALARQPGIIVVATSSLYRTAPWGLADQPAFINAVAALETELAPQELLQVLQALEAAQGRRRDGPRWGPRTLDLDLLLHDAGPVDEANLCLPHPRIAERAFVLVPLAELAPDLLIPGHGRVRDLLAAVAVDGCERLPEGVDARDDGTAARAPGMGLPERALYTTAQVRELDRRASERFSVPGPALMRRAADALWAEILQRWPDARRFVIVCGPGNNGGDGFLLACLARAAGHAVEVVALGAQSRGDAALARERWAAAGGTTRLADGERLPAADLYVDALFGSGLDRAPEGLAAALVDALNAAPGPIIAVDVPSGLDADTGTRLGECVRATLTVCMVGWKRGLFTHAAADCCGERVLATLDLPAELHAGLPAEASLLAAASLPPRARDSHKGDFGHVLVLGGEHGYGGAVRLAGEAALACGAGRVSIATRAAHVAPILAARPELMVHAVADEGVAADLLASASVLVVGPGLGRSAWGRGLLRQALEGQVPLVLDADALNLLAETGTSFGGRTVILTPHPGEAARLLGSDVPTVQADRFAAARAIAEQRQGIVVLKGAGTVLADPGGRLAVCPWGNPAMATAGMGDVLSGILGALLAQHLPAWTAASLGTGLHARAGDRAAAARYSLLASDLFLPLRELVGAARG